MWDSWLGSGRVVGASDALLQLGTLLPERWRTERALVVVDSAVADRADQVVAPLSAAGCEVATLVVPGGESHKTWSTVEQVVGAAVGHLVRRQGLLVGLGGGAVTDLTGFAAAVYLRGVDWMAVPTTLLAQVDAAIGGKTAIDLVYGKNLVGAFHPPRLVVADPRWLATLPLREWRSGLGEIVKAALLQGNGGWTQALELPAPPGGEEQLWPLVEAAVRLKVDVVKRDPNELDPDGGRAILNLGHTVGHAIEAAAGMGPLSHGEAVGVGLLAACWLSEQLVGLDPSVRAALRARLTRWGMPTGVPQVDSDEVVRFVARDKKNRGDTTIFVLLRAPGEAVTAAVPPALVEEVARRAVSDLL